MGTRYKQLQAEERMTLSSLHQQGWSLRAMGRLMGRSPSTLCRELRRNSSDSGYASSSAHHAYLKRRIDARPLPKLHAGRFVADGLHAAQLVLVATANCQHTQAHASR